MGPAVVACQLELHVSYMWLRRLGRYLSLLSGEGAWWLNGSRLQLSILLCYLALEFVRPLAPRTSVRQCFFVGLPAPPAEMLSSLVTCRRV